MSAFRWLWPPLLVCREEKRCNGNCWIEANCICSGRKRHRRSRSVARLKSNCPLAYNQPFSLLATNTTCYITTQREANPHPYCLFPVGQALTRACPKTLIPNCRVVPPVTRRHPHRPLRAQLTHKVPRVMVSLRRSSEPPGLREYKRNPAAGSSAPRTSPWGRPGAPATSARSQSLPIGIAVTRQSCQ